eukprot:5503571-Amphidinium_carterae.2
MLQSRLHELDVVRLSERLLHRNMVHGLFNVNSRIFDLDLRFTSLTMMRSLPTASARREHVENEHNNAGSGLTLPEPAGDSGGTRSRCSRPEAPDRILQAAMAKPTYPICFDYVGRCARE